MRHYLALFVMVPTLASAQPSTDATAAADVLFDEAKVLIEHGDYVHACPKLEASLKLDATAIGTRVNLANCYEHIGRLASAWSMYRSAADRARIAHDPREQLATERAGRLEPRLPRLTILATGAPTNLTVTRAGVEVEAALFGTQVFVDPGKTVVTASAPGFVPYEVTVEMTEGASQQIEVPPLVRAAQPRPHQPTTPAPSAAEPRSAPRRWLGIGVGAGGLAMVATGLVFGAAASSAWDDAFSSGACDRETRRCSPRGSELTDRARGRATASTVLVGVGALAVAAGAYVIITAPKQRAAIITPLTSPNAVGASISGSF